MGSNDMTIRAETERTFLLKFLVIGIACIGFSLYCLYDGLIGYPALLPRAEAWEKLIADTPDEEIPDKWKAISAENGWSPKRPKKEEGVEAVKSRIMWQWIMLPFGLVIGVPCLLWYFSNKGTWVESMANGVRSSWGEEFTFDQVTEFDKKKFEKKGLGVVHYTSNGEHKTFVLDDLKYNRKNMDEIVVLLESNIDRQLIVNGPPEQVPQDDVKSDENDERSP